LKLAGGKVLEALGVVTEREVDVEGGFQVNRDAERAEDRKSGELGIDLNLGIS
jgi:hypothetical protein